MMIVEVGSVDVKCESDERIPVKTRIYDRCNVMTGVMLLVTANLSLVLSLPKRFLMCACQEFQALARLRKDCRSPNQDVRSG